MYVYLNVCLLKIMYDYLSVCLLKNTYVYLSICFKDEMDKKIDKNILYFDIKQLPKCYYQ